jgi:kinetochore protein NDC80
MKIVFLFFFRASKIAVRRPSFNDRQSNAAQSSRPTLNRNTIGTPLRTPLRSNSSDRNVIPMTAEKEKPPLEDRQWLQSKVARIVDELGSIEGLSAEFVQKRNLKSMSTKQFIAILMHFLKPIVGRVQLDTSNYVDYIHDLLPKIEYPFTINKSWLKTPNAPHCQNHIIVLLGWLSDFTLPPHEAAIETEVDQEFFSAELSSMFQKQAAEAFKLWNSNMESEYNHIQDSISRTYLNEKAGIANLGEEIEKATAEYAQLKKERAPVNTKIEYDNVLKDSQQLDQIIRKKTESNNELMKTKEKAIVELNQRMSAVHKTNGEIQELQDQIARQTLSVDRKIELLQDLNNLRDLLGVKERTVTELQENSSQNDIQLSRLLKKKFTLVESLNNQIYKLHSDINLAGMASNFCGGKFVPSLCEVKVTSLSLK